MLDIDNVLIRVQLCDGTEGIADAPSRPTILGDTQKSIVEIINNFYVERLCGIHSDDLTGIWNVLNSVSGNFAAKAAIDLAIHDARAKQLGISCASLLGSIPRPLPVNWRLIRASPDEMLRDAESMIAKYGFKALKVKGGPDIQKDIYLLGNLRREFGPELAIYVDWNQSLAAQNLLVALPRLEDLNIGLIEEPLPIKDSSNRLLCASRTVIPISGDDSCITTDDVLHELRLGAIRAVVIKVARNGYQQARDIVALCKAFHIPLHSGSQGDMHITTCAAAHFACTYTASHEHEFSTFLDARDQICEQNIHISEGLLHLPPGPGIGLTINEEKLNKYRIDK